MMTVPSPTHGVLSNSSGIRKWWILTTVSIGSLMGAIDITVVNIILPVVRRDLGTTVASVEWVFTIYLLVVGALLLTFGRLGDLRGHKRLYVAGFIIFTLSSCLCGLAWNVAALIVARGLQAVGASMIFSSSPAILTGNFPATERGRALGLQAIMIYLGQMVGPPLGGWLTDHFSWRAVFYINAPVGILTITLSMIFIPDDKNEVGTESFDFMGAIFFAVALTALLLGLNRGHERGWTSPLIQALLAGAGLMLIAFVLRERRCPHPLLDPALFRNRVFTLTVVSSILNYAAVFMATFLLPFYLIQGRGLSPSRTGVLFMIQPAILGIVSPVIGELSDRIGTRRPAMTGMAILACGLVLLSRLGASSSLYVVEVGMVLAGLGTGLFFVPNNSAMLGSAPRNRQGIAAGVLATARYVGMILGVGIAGAIFTTFLTRQTATALFEGISAGLITAAVAAFIGCVTSNVRGPSDQQLASQENPLH